MENDKLQNLETINPDKIANISLSAVYERKLFIKPILGDVVFNTHDDGIDWKKLYALNNAQEPGRNINKTYICKSDNGHEFVFKASSHFSSLKM